MPRIGVEAVADQWETHDIQVNIASADGRVFNVFGRARCTTRSGADGKPRVLGAGPLSFELVEPFRHWQMRLDGLAVESTVARADRRRSRRRSRACRSRSRSTSRSAVPPWENGALLPEAKRVLDEQDEGALMGGPRFEQLSRATGTAAGRRRRAPDRRRRAARAAPGRRRLGTFRGHAWQSALFPSGRGFGYIVYPDRDDGLPTYNEGYLFDGDGELIPAWVVDAPWLRRLQPRGEDVSVVLETANGTDRAIQARVGACRTISVMGGVGSNPAFPVLQQAIARYTWDDETANGMMERSMPGDQIDRS